jgi:O-antigen ligase
VNSSTLQADPRRDGLTLGLAVVYSLWVVSGYWKIAPMSIAAGLAAAGWAIAAWTRPVARWVRSPADWGGIAWGLALVLSSAFAVDRSASYPRLVKVMFPFLVGVSAWHARDPRTGLRAAGLILGSASLAALYGIVVFVIRGASFASRARGPVGHYLTFAGQLAIAGSLAIAILLVTRDRRWKWGALAAIAVCAAALAATFSRSSWIGLAVAAAFMTALARPKLLIPGAVLLAVGVAFAPGDYRARLSSIFDPGNRWNEQRTLMWEAGLRMFRDHPWTGVGLQDLHALYERYRSPAAWEPAGHLHSVPVQVAATMGAVGLVALVALGLSLALTVGRGLRARLRDGDPGAAVQLGAAGALVAFAVAGLFEWNLGDEEVLHPLYALIGLAWASRQWNDGTEKPR